MSVRSAREMFAPGERVRVTNHYITREDHPCYGTREAMVARSTTAGLTLEPGGHTPWPKAGQLEHGLKTMTLYGHPKEDDLFLTIEKIT
jgi:hypothetical protein